MVRSSPEIDIGVTPDEECVPNEESSESRSVRHTHGHVRSDSDAHAHTRTHAPLCRTTHTHGHVHSDSYAHALHTHIFSHPYAHAHVRTLVHQDISLKADLIIVAAVIIAAMMQPASTFYPPSKRQRLPCEREVLLREREDVLDYSSELLQQRQHSLRQQHEQVRRERQELQLLQQQLQFEAEQQRQKANEQQRDFQQLQQQRLELNSEQRSWQKQLLEESEATERMQLQQRQWQERQWQAEQQQHRQQQRQHPQSDAGEEREIFMVASSSLSPVGIRTLIGDYVEVGTNHGRKVFQKNLHLPGDVRVVTIMLYYWDSRDGPHQEGWWFGNTIGGKQVWAHCKACTLQPPRSGWKVPWDGAVQPDLTVVKRPVASGSEPELPRGQCRQPWAQAEHADRLDAARLALRAARCFLEPANRVTQSYVAHAARLPRQS